VLPEIRAVPRVVLGITNPDIVSLNLSNSKRRSEQRATFNRLIAQDHIADMAYARQLRLIATMQSVTSVDDRRRVLRFMPTYEEEVLSLAPADRFVILDKLKRSLKIFQAQKERSQTPRTKLGDGDEPLTLILAKWIGKPERREETAWELWPKFSCLLMDHGCSPKEIYHPNRIG
jgi:hypothetical protein